MSELVDLNHINQTSLRNDWVLKIIESHNFRHFRDGRRTWHCFTLPEAPWTDLLSIFPTSRMKKHLTYEREDQKETRRDGLEYEKPNHRRST